MTIRVAILNVKYLYKNSTQTDERMLFVVDQSSYPVYSWL